MKTYRTRAATALLGTALVLTGATAAPGEAHTADRTVDRTADRTSAGVSARVADRAGAGQQRIIKPGKVGKARVGMTVAEAMATGQFDKNVPNPPCDPIRLRPKKPFKRAYSVFVSGGRIVEMAVGGTRPHTPSGLRVGSTYRQVKRAYGGLLSAPREVGYGQWGAFVHTGTGADRRWVGFLLGEAIVADGPVQGSDAVTLISVTKGQRPLLALDGC